MSLLVQPTRIPKEQTRFSDKGTRPVEDAAEADRRDLETETQAGQPGNYNANLDEQSRFGNLKQNLMNQWKVQESSAVART